MTNKLNEILQEIGISKVKLAKYLGVSRQMVYNYLELDSLDKWPKDKKLLMLKLLGIENGDEEELKNIKVTPEYIMTVENKLDQSLQDSMEINNISDIKKLPANEQQLFKDITSLIKDKFTEEYKHNENIAALTYLYHVLQSIDNVKEVKYFLAYISKLTGFTDPNEFKFNEDKQFIFEGIVHSSITLYNNGGASKSRVIESHKRFEEAIKERKEEALSRTQQLTSYASQALRELGYSKFDKENASEFLAKLAEIETRGF